MSQRATGAFRGALSRSRSGSPDRKEAIFGSFDGMTSTLGVAGLLATHATPSKILAAAIGIAVAATTGMSAGQYLSDGKRNLRKAVVMGVATLVGSVLPALPSVVSMLSTPTRFRLRIGRRRREAGGPLWPSRGSGRGGR